MRPARGLRLPVALVVLLLAAQWATAARRDLFGDEAFYAACAARPALAYADHPPLTAALVRAGVALLGWSAPGVRALFFALGVALPLLVAALARELGAGRRAAAWAAAGLAALPLLAVLPTLAVPDVPLVTLQTAALLAAVRAVRRGGRARWLLLGAWLALALATHLRAVLVPLAVGAGLLATPAGRRALRAPGPWCAAAVAALGLAPLLADALRHQGGVLRYQLVERHAAGGAGGVDPAAPLEFLAVQLLLVATPLLAPLLLAAGRELARRARAGDPAAALALAQAVLPLGLFLLASPFSDRERAHQHWTLGAWVPLLALAPSLAARWWRAGGARRALALAGPALGAGLTLLVLVDAHTGWLGVEAIHRGFAGWRETAARTRALVAALPADERPDLLAADHYVLAAQLEFQRRAAGHPEPAVYVLEHPKNREHGRAVQYRRWELDEAALTRRAGARALLVLDLAATDFRARGAWQARAEALLVDPRELHAERLGWPDEPLVLRWILGRLAPH